MVRKPDTSEEHQFEFPPVRQAQGIGQGPERQGERPMTGKMRSVDLSFLPLPALRGERVGVRGCLHERGTRTYAETPPHPDARCRANPTSPRKRGEVDPSRAPVQLGAP